MLELLTDPVEWKKASESGIRRVETYYAQDQMFARYREVYDAALGASPAPGDGAAHG